MLQLHQANSSVSGRVEDFHNLGAMEALYLKHVARFHVNYRDSFQQLCKYLSVMEYDEALRLVHTIKGLAATLGMRNLQFNAEALELTIKEGRYCDLPPLLLEFQTALRTSTQSANLQSSSFVGT